MRRSVLLIAAAAFAVWFAQPTASVASQNVPLSHGRYCGVGNSQEGRAPIDGLDAACMRHDQCAGKALLPSCRCHEEFVAEVKAVMADLGAEETLRQLAGNMIKAITSAPCPK